ncbi:MAG: hypothetical protein PUP92_30815 [Rhizonema sp. PD38]|nr:hypothetical protein [Rhizonema sp. PD38]
MKQRVESSTEGGFPSFSQGETLMRTVLAAHKQLHQAEGQMTLCNGRDK